MTASGGQCRPAVGGVRGGGHVLATGPGGTGPSLSRGIVVWFCRTSPEKPETPISRSNLIVFTC